jgi:hypothetical protein
MDLLNPRDRTMVFYQVFLLSPLQCTLYTVQQLNYRDCKRLREFEEIEISSCRL